GPSPRCASTQISASIPAGEHTPVTASDGDLENISSIAEVMKLAETCFNIENMEVSMNIFVDYLSNIKKTNDFSLYIIKLLSTDFIEKQIYPYELIDNLLFSKQLSLKTPKLNKVEEEKLMKELKNNFDVTLITLNPHLFTLKHRKLNQKQILNYFINKLKLTKDKQHKMVIKYFIEFIEKGGKVKIKIPDMEDIRTEIKNDRPLMVAFTSRFLTQNEAKLNSHANIVTGFDNDYVYINDPEKIISKQKYKINEFLYGVYASAHNNIDDDCFMLVKPR
ncbi:MAG: papain-like cysteine protease family protein, partial [archaeon]